MGSSTAGDKIQITNVPNLPDLMFRHFCGKSDFGPVAAVLTGSSKADQIDRKVTAGDIEFAFERYLTNCDPTTDMILADVAGNVVGYTRGWWTEESPSIYLYKHNGFLLPAWRRKGIGYAMLSWMENRLITISENHPPQSEKIFQVNASQEQISTIILLERSGYRPIRHFYQMVRPNLDDIPDYLLPAGLEIRPVTADHYRAIWESMVESTDEEWGTLEPTENSYWEWQKNPQFQPHLWQIAWDQANDKVVGMVLTFILHDENKEFDRLRGYTEGVGVSSSWRRRGIARALIVRSLQAQKAAGMQESALVADGQSSFGITQLYESCGFQIVDQDTIFRKSLYHR